jgi:hypothetical protein
MAILLQFNDQTKWTVQQLMDNTGNSNSFYRCCCSALTTLFLSTGINYDNMQQILGILLKTRLLEADVEESQLTPETDISLFLGYKK